jgi:hypothetical protein
VALLLACVANAAAYTLHIQSPWPDNTLFVCGNQEFGWWSGRSMTPEGNGWFAVTPTFTQKNAVEELKIYPTISHTTESSIGSIATFYSQGTGLENDVYLVVGGSGSVQVTFTRPTSSVATSSAAALSQGASSSSQAAQVNISSATTHNRGIIAADTLWIDMGDSIDILASGIDIGRWAGTGAYELASDSSIRAMPSKSTVYYVYNFMQANLQNVNPDFEAPAISGWAGILEDNLPGWRTTASDRTIEIWNGADMGVPAYSGAQFAELNANMVGDLYQDVVTTPGTLLSISFAHRGRAGIETLGLMAGPPGGPYTTLGAYSDGTESWGRYKELYGVPAGQTTTRIFFTSEGYDGSGSSVGNFLDAIQYSVVQQEMDSVVVRVRGVVEEILPLTIRFTDAEGRALDPSVTPLGDWSHVDYAVHVGVFQGDLPISDMELDLALYSQDGLVFTDGSGMVISQIRTGNGSADFWVRANTAITNGSFLVGRNDIDEIITWQPINLALPQFAAPSEASAWDGNGDGIADSLALAFISGLIPGERPDSMLVEWGGEETLLAWEQVQGSIAGDSLIRIGALELTGTPFTGTSSTGPYAGNVRFFYTLGSAGSAEIVSVDQPLLDRVGAIIQQANLAQYAAGAQLTLTFSENLEQVDDAQIMSLFEWKRAEPSGELSTDDLVLPRSYTLRRDGVHALLRFGVDHYPELGDSVRFALPSQFSDASGNLVHALNPLCPISGEPALQMTVLPLAQLNSSESPAGFALQDELPNWRITLVDPESSLEQIQADSGVAGVRIHLDLGGYLLADSSLRPEELQLRWHAETYSNIGQFLAEGSGAVDCSDPVFQGGCAVDRRLPLAGWNLRAQDQRKIGSGVYLMRVNISVVARGKTLLRRDKLWRMGVRR